MIAFDNYTPFITVIRQRGLESELDNQTIQEYHDKLGRTKIKSAIVGALGEDKSYLEIIVETTQAEEEADHVTEINSGAK